MGKLAVVEFPVGGGLNEKLAKQYLDPGAGLAAVTNGNFTKTGSVDKRLGLQHLPTTVLPGSELPSLSSGVRAVSWSRSALSVASTQGLYARSAAENGVMGVGPLPAVVPQRRPIVTTPQAVAPVLCDMPYNGTTLRIALYLGTNYSVFATVSDANTGDVVLQPTLVYAATGALPSVPTIIQVMYLPNAPAGLRIVAILYDVNTLNLYGCHYNPATNAFDTPVLLLPTGVCDACPFAGDPNGGFLIFYVNSATSCRYLYVAPNFSLISSGPVENVSGTGYEMSFPLFVEATAGAGEAVWFSYQVFNPTSGLYAQRVMALTSAFGTLLGPIDGATGFSQIFAGGIVRASATTLLIPYWQGIGTGGPGQSTMIGNWWLVTTGGVITDGNWPMGYLPIARPFLVGTTLYCACALALYLQTSDLPKDPHSEQGTIFLLKFFPGLPNGSVSQWLPVCTVAPRQVDLAFTFLSVLFEFGHIPLMSVSSTDGSAVRFACGLKTLGEDIAGLSGAQGATWWADFFFDAVSQAALYQAYELGSELHLSAGSPMVADGNAAFEDSFFYYPEFTYIATVGTTPLRGTFSYAVVYVYPDAAGLLHRSAPVFAGPVTTDESGVGHHLIIPTLSATWRDIANTAQVRAEIYRTLVDGTTFYLIDRIVVSGMTATPTVTWPVGGGPDVTPDTTIAVASILYTTGGVLDNVCPPSASLLITHRSRLVLVDETLRQTWESKTFEPGEAPGFHETLITPYPEGGDITGLGSMDDKLVVFKASSIWVRVGDGPADTGQGSDWTEPLRVASDVGCISWASIVLTPMGLMFQAKAGIYLLDRGLQVTFIGKNVVGRLQAFPNIITAVLVPEANQVRFLASTGASGTSAQTQLVIVYDYLQNQWTSHSFGQVPDPVASMVKEPSGQVAVLSNAGELWQEHLPTDAGAFLDDDTSGIVHFVPTSATWPWIKVQGVQAYQRVRRAMPLVEILDDAGLQMQLAFDYDPSIRETTSWDDERIQERVQALGPAIQVEHHVSGAYNKRQAIQVTLTDTPGATMTTGQGARLVNLSLEIDVIGPRNRRLPARLRT